MRCNWTRVVENIAAELRARQGADSSARYSLDELFEQSGGSQEPDGYRSRSYWAAVARGDPSWATARDAGLVVNFEPDERGREVTHVIFRLDRR